ncbi:MAG: CoA pyrophosphatase [Pseudomonadota bacterium]|nr:CoA pyrophosphatase [Pseudomonadota bacterium]
MSKDNVAKHRADFIKETRQKLSQEEHLIEGYSRLDERFFDKTIISALKDKYTDKLTQASVMVPFLYESNAISLLLTKRSKKLNEHAGEICFPGGRWAPGDKSLTCTALRETQEEIGANKESIEIIGFLKSIPTLTGYLIHPVVGVLDSNSSIVIDKSEVDSYFLAPLSFFLDKNNKKKKLHFIKSIQIPVYEYQFEGHRIWGATAAIISSLCKTLTPRVRRQN